MFVAIIKFINLIISGIGFALAWVIGFLPNSPFSFFNNAGVESYLGGLAWIIPFSQIIAILQLWTSAIVIYYIYVTILRWIKVIK